MGIPMWGWLVGAGVVGLVALEKLSGSAPARLQARPLPAGGGDPASERRIVATMQRQLDELGFGPVPENGDDNDPETLVAMVRLGQTGALTTLAQGYLNRGLAQDRAAIYALDDYYRQRQGLPAADPSLST